MRDLMVALVLVWLAVGIPVAVGARDRGWRDPLSFGLIAILGPFGLLLVAASGHEYVCPNCKKGINRAASICPYCRSVLTPLK